MVKIIKTVPEKKATMIELPRKRPSIIGAPGKEIIAYPPLEIPQSLKKEYLKKCGVKIEDADFGLTKSEVKNKAYDTSVEKGLFVRYADDLPLSVVTGKFSEINPRELVSTGVRTVGTLPKVRYFSATESLQMHFPVDSHMKGMYVFIDTGRFGTYGGSGRDAVQYGIAWHNRACSNWTVFLGKDIQESFGRVIHKGEEGLEAKLVTLSALVAGVENKIEDSSKKYFAPTELEAYFEHYGSKGIPKMISGQIMSEAANGMSAFELSYRLTELCQDPKLSDRTRGTIEFLAGEVILCYDKIIDKIAEPTQKRNMRKANQLVPGLLNYVSTRPPRE